MTRPYMTMEKAKVPDKPADLTGPLSQAWDYLVNRNGLCDTAEFDDDFAPVGPSLRLKLASHGVGFSTSGKRTIMFFLT